MPHASNEAPISRIVTEVAAQFPGARISLGDMAQAFGEILASEGRFERGRQFVVVTGDILEWLTGKKCRSESK